MSDCCASRNHGPSRRNRRRCPNNGVEYREVWVITVMHQVRHAWQRDTRGQKYYYCEDPECEIVYFSDSGSVIRKSEMRTSVGIKSQSADAPVCYCFGVTKADIETNPAIKDFVAAQTKHGLCSCRTCNPSGRCCLKDFPPQPAQE